MSSQCLLEGAGQGEGVLATSATGHDAFAQIANANAGFWFCPAQSLYLRVFWANGKHKLVNWQAQPPCHTPLPLSTLLPPTACRFYLVQLIECGPNTY